jgi:hypothetical protein
MSATYCTTCGTEIGPGQRFCGNCGRPAGATAADPPGSIGSVSGSVSQSSGKAVAALVLGIAGFVVFPVVCSVLAIVLGRQAKHEIAADPRLTGAGMANAGEVLGWIGLVLTALALLFFITVVASFSQMNLR